MADAGEAGSAVRLRGAGAELVAEDELDMLTPGSFGLTICFGVLECSADAGILLDRLAATLEPGGLLFVSLRSPLSGAGSQARTDLIAELEHRFGEIRTFAESSLAVAGAKPLPELSPPVLPTEEPLVDALAKALDRWEGRAREAEAEAAASHWELRLAGEKLTTLVQRLYVLENSRLRRLARRLRGRDASVPHVQIATGRRYRTPRS